MVKEFVCHQFCYRGERFQVVNTIGFEEICFIALFLNS